MAGGRLLPVWPPRITRTAIPGSGSVKGATESTHFAAEHKSLAPRLSCRIRSPEAIQETSMPGRFRPRLSYANVASTLALVLALGGVSYAAVKINGKSIKDRTVGAKKIKKNSLTATEINKLKLGKVPSAANADTATNANSIGGQSAASFKLSCPQGTTLAIGECFELSLRAADTWSGANKTCGSVGRRLPTFSELESARQNNVAVGVPPNNYEMSGSNGYEGTDKYYAIDPSGFLLREPLANTRPFRCIQSPTN